MYFPAWDTLSGLNRNLEIVVVLTVTAPSTVIPLPFVTTFLSGPIHRIWGVSVILSSSTAMQARVNVSPVVGLPPVLMDTVRAEDKMVQA